MGEILLLTSGPVGTAIALLPPALVLLWSPLTQRAKSTENVMFLVAPFVKAMKKELLFNNLSTHRVPTAKKTVSNSWSRYTINSPYFCFISGLWTWCSPARCTQPLGSFARFSARLEPHNTSETTESSARTRSVRTWECLGLATASSPRGYRYWEWECPQMCPGE